MIWEKPGWFVNGIRTVFFVLDMVIYWIIGALYDVFMVVAGTPIFTQENMAVFADRIIALLGIFMLFKVGFSIVQVIANPDRMTDKEKGFGKIITSVLVVIIMLIFTPTIFKFAYDIQTVILNENIIGNLVMGNESKTDINKTRQILTAEIYSNFMYIDPEVADDKSGFVGPGKLCSGISASNFKPGISINEQDLKEIDRSCAKVELGGNISSLMRVINVPAGSDDGKIYVFNYTPLIPAVVGAIVAFLFFTFTIDVAIRAFKFGVLQLMAPIPIISYIDPASAKNGAFKKWVTECIKTYVSLFVRILMIFLIFELIPIVTEGLTKAIFVLGQEANNVNMVTIVFAKIFIIIGLLIFASQAPKFIMDIFGIKSEGTLNPIKKIGQSAFARGAFGLASGAIGGGISNLTRGTQRTVKAFKSSGFAAGVGQIGKTLASGAAGIGSGALKGMNSGVKSKDDFLKAANKAVQDNNKLREGRIKRHDDYAKNDDERIIEEIKERVFNEQIREGQSFDIATKAAETEGNFLEKEIEKGNRSSVKKQAKIYNIDRAGGIKETFAPGINNVLDKKKQQFYDYTGVETKHSTSSYSKDINKLETEKQRLENAFGSLSPEQLMSKDSTGEYADKTARNLNKEIVKFDKQIKRLQSNLNKRTEDSKK